MNLSQILALLDSVAKTSAVLVPGSSAAILLADSLLQIAQSAVAQHEQLVGAPLDLALLHNIDPIE